MLNDVLRGLAAPYFSLGRVKIAIGDDGRETTFIIGEIRIYSPIVTEDTGSTSESMLESIEWFIEAGLFQPSTTPYSITLHAIVSGGSETHPVPGS